MLYKPKDTTRKRKKREMWRKKQRKLRREDRDKLIDARVIANEDLNGGYFLNHETEHHYVYSDTNNILIP